MTSEENTQHTPKKKKYIANTFLPRYSTLSFTPCLAFFAPSSSILSISHRFHCPSPVLCATAVLLLDVNCVSERNGNDVIVFYKHTYATAATRSTGTEYVRERVRARAPVRPRNKHINTCSLRHTHSHKHIYRHPFHCHTCGKQRLMAYISSMPTIFVVGAVVVAVWLAISWAKE